MKPLNKSRNKKPGTPAMPIRPCDSISQTTRNPAYSSSSESTVRHLNITESKVVNSATTKKLEKTVVLKLKPDVLVKYPSGTPDPRVLAWTEETAAITMNHLDECKVRELLHHEY